MNKYLVSYAYYSIDGLSISNTIIEWDSISEKNIKAFEYDTGGYIISITKLDDKKEC